MRCFGTVCHACKLIHGKTTYISPLWEICLTNLSMACLICVVKSEPDPMLKLRQTGVHCPLNGCLRAWSAWRRQVPHQVQCGNAITLLSGLGIATSRYPAA